jgi:hypothetical protein
MPIPILLYIGTIGERHILNFRIEADDLPASPSVLSCLLLAAISLPTWTALDNDTFLIYYAFVVTLNLLITLLIVARVISMRTVIRRYMGAEHCSVYISVSAMLIESAVLYSCFDLALIITVAMNAPGQYILQPVAGQIEVSRLRGHGEFITNCQCAI